MQAVVTGAMNPFGDAIVRALAAAGHQVRAFGVPAGQDPFQMENVQNHAGQIEVTGSIEPVLAQREALIHAACMDAPGKDKVAHAFMIERGTLGCRYGVEREQVDRFVHVTPAKPGKFAANHQKACEEAQKTRGANVKIVQGADPEQTARDVLKALDELPSLGMIEGANDAVTV